METKQKIDDFVANTDHAIVTSNNDLDMLSQPSIIYDLADPDTAYMFRAGVHGSAYRWHRDRKEFEACSKRDIYIERAGTTYKNDVLVIRPSYIRSGEDVVAIELSTARIAPVKRDFNFKPSDQEGAVRAEAHFARRAEQYLNTITEQIHNIADEEDWCNEFDELLYSLGLETRSREYVSSVTATFTADVDSPPSQVDEAVSRWVSDGPDVVLSSMTIVGTIDVNVYWTGSRGDEENFDSSEVEAAVEDALGVSADVIDWHINETELSE